MPPENENEIAEYVQYLKSQGQDAKKADEYGAYLRDQRTLSRFKQGPASIPDAFVNMQKKAMEYLGNLGSTAVAAPVSAITEYGTDKKNAGQAVSTALGDIGNAFINNAPGGQKIAERHFVPGSTSAKVAAPVIDIASALASGQIAKFLGPVLYRQAFRYADAAAKDVGKGPRAVSDASWKYDVTGNEDEIVSQTDNLIDKLNSNRAKGVNIIEESGNKLDPKVALRIARERAEKAAQSLDPDTAANGQKMMAYLDEVETNIAGRPAIPETKITKQVPSTILDETGSPIIKPVEEIIPGMPARPAAGGQAAQNLKTDVTKSVGNKGYQVINENPVSTEVKKGIGTGMKQELERLAGKAGIGEEFKGINEDLGTFLTARKALSNDSTRAMKKLPISQVDMMAMGIDPAVFAMKQGGKIAGGASFLTKGGKALHNTGTKIQLVSPVKPAFSLWDEEEN